jgi:PAS domain S-box-containing protein
MLKPIDTSADNSSPPKRGEWERFIYEGVISTDVRELVRESWKRCATMKVDPFISGAQQVLSPEEIAIRKKRSKDFLAIARPYLDTLCSLVGNLGTVIFLTNEEGVVLLLSGDPEELRRQGRINLVEGAIWTEHETGTNAVGTAIAIGQPVQIVGGEHYCFSQHEITCSAAPIFRREELAGVLNLSMACDRTHPHTLGMVAMTAKLIEGEMNNRQALDTEIAIKSWLDATLSTVPKGIVTLNSREEVKFVNHAAANILGLDAEEVVGKHIDLVFNCTPPLSRMMEKGLVMDNMEVTLEREKKSQRFTISVRPISVGSETFAGGVILIEGKEVHRLVTEMAGAQAHLTFHNIIGTSPVLLKARDLARSAALTNSTVLLLGESGTGKELFAQSIHNGSRRKGPFIAVNCSAIPRTLIESELFGYEAGSFTGASRSGRPGKFELAHGGTIFLDEIGDMPLDLQTVLLRVLQERQIVRVGGHKPISINVRVVAATNRDLLARVNEGAMREDLYYRLNVVTVLIPSLRERRDDIPLLISHLLPQISARMGKMAESLTPRALQELCRYDWPGNVRELENVLERAAIMASGGVLDLGDIPELGGHIKPQGQGRQEAELLPLEEVERRAIVFTLERTNSIAASAKILGISRSSIYRKMHELKIPLKGRTDR